MNSNLRILDGILFVGCECHEVDIELMKVTRVSRALPRTCTDGSIGNV